MSNYIDLNFYLTNALLVVSQFISIVCIVIIFFYVVTFSHFFFFFFGKAPELKFSLSLSLVAKSCPSPVTPLTVAHQIPLSTGFPRQEYWSGLPCPSPGDLPNPGIEPSSPAL